jgi:hypothetical protein
MSGAEDLQAQLAEIVHNLARVAADRAAQAEQAAFERGREAGALEGQIRALDAITGAPEMGDDVTDLAGQWHRAANRAIALGHPDSPQGEEAAARRVRNAIAGEKTGQREHWDAFMAKARGWPERELLATEKNGGPPAPPPAPTPIKACVQMQGRQVRYRWLGQPNGGREAGR